MNYSLLQSPFPSPDGMRAAGRSPYFDGSTKPLLADAADDLLLSWSSPLDVPMVVTLFAGLIVTGAEAGNDDLSAIRISVTWGTRCATHPTMVADLVGGFSHSFSAEMLTAKASYGAGASGSTRPAVSVTCSVAPFPGPSFAYRTILIGTVASAATSALFAVPTWAKTATLVNATAAVAAVRMRQWTANSTNSTQVAEVTLGKGQADAQPVAAGARYFDLINNGGASSARTAVAFELGG